MLRQDVIATARLACRALKLTATQTAVLCAMASCYGEQALERGLIVWPSNDYLAEASGVCERSVRRIVAQLQDLELLVPQDSPNRKRFAVRDADGAIVDAFGFDLRPMMARRDSFQATLEARKIQRERVKREFDAVTIARKACQEGLRSIAHYFPAIAIVDLVHGLESLISITPARSRDAGALKPCLLEAWQKLRDRIEALFVAASEEMSGRTGQDVPHKEQPKEPSSEPCKPSGDASGEVSPGTLSPELVLGACPAVRTYGADARDLGTLAGIGERLRPTIGAHGDAFAEAAAGMGRLRAALLVLYVLQVHEDDVTSGANRIKNPGGLYRKLARDARDGLFDLARELRALKRRKMT